MNIPRRIAALRREIRYRENEIERIAELRMRDEPTIVLFPERIDEYLKEIRAGIESREKEVASLEKSG